MLADVRPLVKHVADHHFTVFEDCLGSPTESQPEPEAAREEGCQNRWLAGGVMPLRRRYTTI